MKRYFCREPETLQLDAQESHHCLDVMRQGAGDFFTVFNGAGLEIKAQISATEKGIVHFKKIAETRSLRPVCSLILAQAITKGKSMEVILQKATELGAAEIVPLQSERTISQLEGEQIESRRQKWEQVTIEAAKQCGQNWLPKLHPLQKPADFLEGAEDKETLKLIGSLQPEAKPIKTVLRQSVEEKNSFERIVMMIGPEGDFTPAEIGLARAHGYLPVSLGATVLRSETAAIFCLSALLYEFS